MSLKAYDQSGHRGNGATQVSHVGHSGSYTAQQGQLYPQVPQQSGTYPPNAQQVGPYHSQPFNTHPQHQIDPGQQQAYRAPAVSQNHGRRPAEYTTYMQQPQMAPAAPPAQQTHRVAMPPMARTVPSQHHVSRQAIQIQPPQLPRSVPGQPIQGNYTNVHVPSNLGPISMPSLPAIGANAAAPDEMDIEVIDGPPSPIAQHIGTQSSKEVGRGRAPRHSVLAISAAMPPRKSTIRCHYEIRKIDIPVLLAAATSAPARSSKNQSGM